MAFDVRDPRAKLVGMKSESAVTVDGFGTAEYAKFYETEPPVRDDAGATWIARGQNFVVAYSELAFGAVLERKDQRDEYVLLLPDPKTSVSIETDAESVDVPGDSVVFVPPGRSAIRLSGDGRIARVFTAESDDLVALCSNRASYETRKPNLPPFEPWPAPRSGYRVRAYSLTVRREAGRFGRIWRGSTIMINYSEPRMGPRDVTKMSPHVHEDFEQGSLVLDGSFVHHLRWPWGTDMRRWRNDEHEICAGRSLAVIPPRVIHTSQQVAPGLNQLVDIFSPPRIDFSKMDGWVLNADEYPMPAD
jgi:hypothetical protein